MCLTFTWGLQCLALQITERMALRAWGNPHGVPGQTGTSRRAGATGLTTGGRCRGRCASPPSYSASFSGGRSGLRCCSTHYGADAWDAGDIIVRAAIRAHPGRAAAPPGPAGDPGVAAPETTGRPNRPAAIAPSTN